MGYPGPSEFAMPTTSTPMPLVTTVRQRDASRGHPTHQIPRLLSEAEIERLDADGFLLIRQAFPSEDLARWRAATDRLAVGRTGDRAGVFLRDLPLHDPVFQEVMRFPLGVSVAQLMLGPNVRVRGVSARVIRPHDDDVGFGWHIHHRLWCDPVPRWFSPPQAIDCLFYLDTTSGGAGRTCVIPGSHRRPDMDLPWNEQSTQVGEVTVSAEAGDCLIMHSNLWHRALPATVAGSRRLLILGYVPSWYRGCPYGDAEGLLRLANGDPAWDRLCGIGGYT